MPNKQAAKKAWRQTKKHLIHNNKLRTGVQVNLRAARKAVVAGGKEAATQVKKAITVLDKAAQKGILKKNTVARLKSRLMKQANKISK